MSAISSLLPTLQNFASNALPSADFFLENRVSKLCIAGLIGVNITQAFGGGWFIGAFLSKHPDGQRFEKFCKYATCLVGSATLCCLTAAVYFAYKGK